MKRQWLFLLLLIVTMYCPAMDRGELTARLAQAVLAGNVEVAGILLTRSVNINATDGGGNTMLHCAISRGYSAIVEMLLHSKASVDKQNHAGQTPLHIAAAHWYLDIVNGLMLAGAKINGEDADRRTPLVYALMLIDPDHIKAEQKQMILWLISAGATMGANTNRRLFFVLQRVLAKNIAAVTNLIPSVTRYGYRIPQEVQSLIDHAVYSGQDMNEFPDYVDTCFFSPYGQGESLVHIAARCSCSESLQCVFDHGGNANAITQKPHGLRVLSPLSMAIFWDRYENVRFLVEHGADVDGKEAVAAGHLSPLQWALKKRNRAVASFLVDHGACIVDSDKREVDFLLNRSGYASS